jgi:hypothetical protein
MSRREAVRLAVAVMISLLAGISGAFAQGQTGSIAGIVKDTSGAVMPGVTVEAASPALIEKVRTVVTDGQGTYKIIDLRPGVYSVTFTLAGFATFKREGIELTTSFTAPVNAEMKIGTLAETVTVSGESPIVDVQNVMQKSTVSREVMDSVPTDRNFVSFAALQPGVLVTGVRQNVGGSIPETGMNLVIHGSRAGDSLVMVDGMPIINGSGNGGLQYGNYLNNAMAQEITFQTDSQSAEFERASVYSNFIPKEGSNAFHGLFSGRFTNDSLESDNLDATYIAQGLKSGSKVSKIWDANPAGGGPIVKDKMWIYMGYRHWGTYNTVAGSFKDADFTEFPYYSCKPDASGACTTEQNLFPVWHWAADARLTTQFGSKNKVNVYYDPQYTFFGNCFVPSLATAISACPQYKNIPQYIIQGSWSSPVTNKLLLEAGATLTAQDFHGYPQTGVPLTQFQVSDSLAPAGSPTTWGSASYGAARSDQSNYRASASYVTGTHAVKVGFTLMHQWRLSTQEPNNSVSLTLRNTAACQTAGVECGAPFSLTQFATPIEFREHVNYNMGIFAQDQWTFKRLTANYGVRLDFLNASVDAQNLVAGPFTPARNFEGVPNVPNWKDVNPRFGIAYDLTGNGKTALKASIGRYVIADSYTIARSVNPMQSSVNSTTRTWADPSGTFNPFNDCDLTNLAANSKVPGQAACGAVASPLFGQIQTRTTNYDPDLVVGWGVRPNNWEAQVSIQRELIPRVSVYAGYSRRMFGNLQVTRNLAVSNSSFTGYGIPIPVDLRLSNSGGTLTGLYDINRPTTANNLITTDKTAGVSLQDVYDGFDFSASARLNRGLTVSGGVGVGRERTNNCDLLGDLSLVYGPTIGAQYPRTTPYCDIHPPFQPGFKGQATYAIPRGGIIVSANFQGLPGPQLNASYPLTNAIALPSLGRNFTNVPPSVELVPPGTLYGDRIYQTDVRLSKTIKTGRTSIRPTISFYNLFNANPIQTYTTTFGAAWLAPTVILNPRFMDFGVQIDF